MKHSGSTFEYEQARNEDLMRAYHKLLYECSSIHLPDIFRQVVNMPAERFWVSEERAAIVIASMLRGDQLENMRPTNREKYQEIYKRVLELRKEHPGLSVYNLTFMAVHQPAPKFYLTPGSAKVIIYKIKSKWYQQRKRKLRHLF